MKAKSQLLAILRDGDLPCRRLFLDYHGLRLLHSWMGDFNTSDRMSELKFRFDILQTLEILPITNKTMLQDSKVLSCVERWSKKIDYIDKNFSGTTGAEAGTVPVNDESSPSDSGSGTPISCDGTIASPKTEEPPSAESVAGKQADVLKNIPQIIEQSSALKVMGVDMLKRIISTNEKNSKIIEDSQTNDKLPDGELGKLIREVRLLAMKLVTTWEQLPESFRIPKKLRIEQMKEHEREADQGYKRTLEEATPPPEAAISSRFQERFREREKDRSGDSSDTGREKDPRHRSNRYAKTSDSTLQQKIHRRQMFEAKVIEKLMISL